MCLTRVIPISSDLPIMTHRIMGVTKKDGALNGIGIVAVSPITYGISRSHRSDPAVMYSSSPTDYGYHSILLDYKGRMADYEPVRRRTLSEGETIPGIYSVVIDDAFLLNTDFDSITSIRFHLNPTSYLKHEYVLYAPKMRGLFPSDLAVRTYRVVINQDGLVTIYLRNGRTHTIDASRAKMRYEDALRLELKKDRKLGRMITPLWQRKLIKKFIEEED